MSKTTIGFMHTGEIFEFNGRQYKIGHLIENTNGYVACTDIHTKKTTRLYIDTLVDDMKEADNEQ